MQTNYVFLLNADKTFLNMVHPARARELQKKGKAAVFRVYPHVLILKNQVLNPLLHPYILKIDPGSKHTGFAIQCGDSILFRMELEHRGETIKSDMSKRAGFRRSRRARNTRYRKARFDRKKAERWLAPSIKHRLLTTETWIKRFMRHCPIQTIEIELVRFDTQKMLKPEIDGVEYQQGTLFGYEVREYLLEKWGRQCVYCSEANTALEIEHIQPKSKGGTDRVSNLTLACHECNQQKGNQDIKDFLSGKPDLLKRVLADAKQPLKDAAAVNSTRFAIVESALKLCNSVKCWTGGRTKFNRCSQGLPKTHSIDAACVGESGENIVIKTQQALIVKCKGHGNRQARRANAQGFPAVKNAKATYKHITTGDLVKVNIKKPRKNIKAGVYTARVKTPTPKGFEVLIDDFRIGVSTMKDVKFIHRNDGYSYEFPKTTIYS